MNLKSKSLISIIIFLSSCHNDKKSSEKIYVEEKKLLEIMKEKPVIFLSCTRCGCMIEELEKIYKSNPTLLNKFDFLTDTTCLDYSLFREIVRHTPQNKLDSIYKENYNVLLFKNDADSIKYTLIETKNSSRMEKILIDF